MPTTHDVVIRGGTIYDGSGGTGVVGDVAIDGDTISVIGRVPERGTSELDARGLAVSPGFINMLSWATDSLFADGRSQSDIRQGVTLEVFGEGYHLKQAGKANWPKLDLAIAHVERARHEGLAITADMYPYEAGATGLGACFPPWAHDGGPEELRARLRDETQRARIRDEMARPGEGWENLSLAAGGADGILLVAFKSERLKPLTGRTLADIARERGGDPRDVAMDLVAEDEGRVGMIVFMGSQENLRREVGLPWMSFGSDAGSMAPEGVFLRSQPHPRTYGTFARVLGHFVRDQGAAPLEDVIRRMTSFPAANLKLDRRGSLAPGSFADVVVFDPKTIQDHATYAEPHRYATGVRDVFVNGVQVLRDGEHTDARPGRVVRRPGARAKR